MAKSKTCAVLLPTTGADMRMCLNKHILRYLENLSEIGVSFMFYSYSGLILSFAAHILRLKCGHQAVLYVHVCATRYPPARKIINGTRNMSVGMMNPQIILKREEWCRWLGVMSADLCDFIISAATLTPMLSAWCGKPEIN